MGVRLQFDCTELCRVWTAAADPRGRRHGRFESAGCAEFAAFGTTSRAKLSQRAAVTRGRASGERAAAQRARPRPQVGVAQGGVLKLLNRETSAIRDPADLVLRARSSLRAGSLLTRSAALGGPRLRARLLYSVIGVQQTVIHRVACRCRRVLQPQPVHHLKSMFFDGLDAAPEIPGNSLVGISQRNAYQDLTFARRHFGKLRLAGLRGRTPLLAYRPQWPFRMLIFRSLGADRAQQDFEWREFEDVAVDTRRHSGAHAFLAAMAGKQ